MGTLVRWVAALGMLAQVAQAGPMEKEEFFGLIGGVYHSTQPSQASMGESEGIRIVEKEGEIFLENHLFTGTKHLPAIYQVANFECYNHAITSTTCAFHLNLVDQGVFVHFLGIHPNVRVDRLSPILGLEISADFERAEGHVADTLVTKGEFVPEVQPVKIDTTLNILTNANGFTAYIFDLDKPGVSNCNGTCAQEWPPILVGSASLQVPFTVVTRKDGTKQVAYKGKPLYLYVEDSGPGDQSGDGYSSVWHTARP